MINTHVDVYYLGYKRSPENLDENGSVGYVGLNLLKKRAVLLGRGGAPIVSDNFDLDTGFWGRLFGSTAAAGLSASSATDDLENLFLILLSHVCFSLTGGVTFPFPLFCVLDFRLHLQITVF